MEIPEHASAGPGGLSGSDRLSLGSAGAVGNLALVAGTGLGVLVWLVFHYLDFWLLLDRPSIIARLPGTELQLAVFCCLEPAANRLKCLDFSPAKGKTIFRGD